MHLCELVKGLKEAQKSTRNKRENCKQTRYSGSYHTGKDSLQSVSQQETMLWNSDVLQWNNLLIISSFLSTYHANKQITLNRCSVNAECFCKQQVSNSKHAKDPQLLLTTSPLPAQLSLNAYRGCWAQHWLYFVSCEHGNQLPNIWARVWRQVHAVRERLTV